MTNMRAKEAERAA